MNIKKMIWVFVAMGMMAVSTANAADAQKELMKSIIVLMDSRVRAQTVAKDYLYIGNGIAVSKAKKEMKHALKTFDENMAKASGFTNDPKLKNLMTYINMNVQEIKETIKQPYSLDNAAIVIDLAEAISEGELKIAKQLRKKLTLKTPIAKGQRYYIQQIAKYYMAYQAGLKDDVTIADMEKTVDVLEKLIAEMKKNPNNTVQSNKIINEIEREWGIVKQFYLDIAEGGLPLIVYHTSDKMSKNFRKYTSATMGKASDLKKGK